MVFNPPAHRVANMSPFEPLALSQPIWAHQFGEPGLSGTPKIDGFVPRTRTVNLRVVETVKARIWPRLEPFLDKKSFEPLKLIPLRSEAEG